MRGTLPKRLRKLTELYELLTSMFLMRIASWSIVAGEWTSHETPPRCRNDLEKALAEVTAGQSVSVPLTNPISCNVKWLHQDAHWMPADACDLV